MHILNTISEHACINVSTSEIPRVRAQMDARMQRRRTALQESMDRKGMIRNIRIVGKCHGITSLTTQAFTFGMLASFDSTN